MGYTIPYHTFCKSYTVRSKSASHTNLLDLIKLIFISFYGSIQLCNSLITFFAIALKLFNLFTHFGVLAANSALAITP